MGQILLKESGDTNGIEANQNHQPFADTSLDSVYIVGIVDNGTRRDEIIA